MNIKKHLILAPSLLAAAYALIGYESTQGEADFSAHYLSRKLDIGNNVYATILLIILDLEIPIQCTV
ncbi:MULTISPECIES: hypothetical protein [unclassified Chryseobacterium]|uniref:hypothetical protein n=1 Tax=unclassified Chryseobacterium TaxID=2593645 RepID=UPI00300F862C